MTDDCHVFTKCVPKQCHGSRNTEPDKLYDNNSIEYLMTNVFEILSSPYDIQWKLEF
jgi:hypothetical protein